eukprot:scaffold362861_cov17-Prasinocladus_malaysianus.AAC.1
MAHDEMKIKQNKINQQLLEISAAFPGKRAKQALLLHLFVSLRSQKYGVMAGRLPESTARGPI